MRSKLQRTYCIFLLAVITAVILSGCSQAVPENTDRIKSPSNKHVPVTGTWVLEECQASELAEVIDEYDPMVGETLSFLQGTMLYAGEIYTDISYKVKRVNVHEYFLHKKAGLPDNINYTNNEIMVVTVYSGDNFIFEFIEDKDGALIAVVDVRYYNMRKISDEISNVQQASEDELLQESLDDARALAQSLRSGLLLGVRIPITTEDGLVDYKYGTYWISCVDHMVRPVYHTDEIYLPRMDGFWKLIVEKEAGSFGLEDTLRAYKVSNAQSKPQGSVTEKISDNMETKLRKVIVYVGNDYACVENTVYGAGNGIDTADIEAEKTLRTLPVDNLSNIDGIKISDMAGENGTMAMENAISDVLKNSGYEGIVVFDEDIQQKNFALYRKTGHWFFKGRIDPDGHGQLPYMDFNLNLLPPSNMVAFDELHVSWKEMKDKHPYANDIYTSPNEDMAVILTRNGILLYTISNGRLSDEPLAKLEMEEGSSVIMAEWCMGEYVSIWEKSFINNNEASIVENTVKTALDENSSDEETAAQREQF